MNKKVKPDATPIRKETKKTLKMRAAYHGMSLVDYLEDVLNYYFEETEKGSINEVQLLDDSENKKEND